jgi:hypothetical protein
MGYGRGAIIFGVGAAMVLAFSSAVRADSGKSRERPAGLATVAPSAVTALGDAGASRRRETAEQRTRRAEYVRAGGAKIRATAKVATPEIAALVKKHWRIALRLLRVQNVAESAGKPATAKRAAELLAKEDARFYAKLAALAKGPASPASPSASPTASGASK